MSNRIWVVIGTAGELIKVFPVLREFDRRYENWVVLFTGQSPVNFFKQYNDFCLPLDRAVVAVDSACDLTSSKQAMLWFLRAVLFTTAKLKRTIKRSGINSVPMSGDIWLVHGDTLSTLVGAIWSKYYRGTLGHIEAGLRSKSLFNPFPEEITRRVVSRFAKVHYPQDKVAVENLKNSRVAGDIFCTHANTLLDAMDLIVENNRSTNEENFVVANLHRFENLNNQKKWNFLIDTLCNAAKKNSVLLVMHPPTCAKLESDQDSKNRLIAAGVKLYDRLPFIEFINLLNRASFVISDGGSNQEECSYLGIPCLILRGESERVEGLKNGSCLLSNFSKEHVANFIENYESFRRTRYLPNKSPSAIICDSIGKL